MLQMYYIHINNNYIQNDVKNVEMGFIEQKPASCTCFKCTSKLLQCFLLSLKSSSSCINKKKKKKNAEKVHFRSNNSDGKISSNLMTYCLLFSVGPGMNFHSHFSALLLVSLILAKNG